MRFEHYFDVGESQFGSQPAQVNIKARYVIENGISNSLQEVIRFMRIVRVYEMMLGGDRPLNGKWTELTNLTITIQPFDIRTFIIDGIYM